MSRNTSVSPGDHFADFVDTPGALRPERSGERCRVRRPAPALIARGQVRFLQEALKARRRRSTARRSWRGCRPRMATRTRQLRLTPLALSDLEDV
ncbi:hypothetical protein BUPH_08394 (plasmid) [Paraburkholderia phenoliruptrix BR3459a]|uniref:Uncharacterized protein n=1 Tax=Paraburkholderia phenoliruptrix BR3459a TaxID=1229205 RepID=K0E0V3_9BURK|nr:hypothetical protein BUPH_08394 [Paraburkholderia phenoliruptrix BR3459a]